MTLIRPAHINLGDPADAALHALDTLPAMVAFWDRDERNVYANTAYLEWFGRKPDELPGMHLAELLGDGYAFVHAFALRALDGEVATFERELTRPDGRTAQLAGTLTPAWSDGNVVGFCAYVRDVTDLHATAAEVSRANDILRRTSELAQVGGGSWTVGAPESYWSPELRRLYDIEGPALPSFDERIGFIADEAARADFREAYARLWSDGVPFERTVAVKTATGRACWMRIRNSAEREDGVVKRVITAHQDVTEQLQAEQARAQLETMLQHAQRMESIGRLAGGVAHDFNNMLAVILGNSEMALSEIAPTHPLVPMLREIEEAARRSSDLTRQLLTFARQTTLSPKQLDFDAAIAGTLRMLRRLIGEAIRVEFAPGATERTVLLDPTQLDQILANLCVNARDAIEGAGSITIGTSTRMIGEAECARDPELTPGEYVILRVTDTGVGMSPEVLEHVFEPFFTTKADGVGTGLGLATVYGAVHQNHGFVRVHSAEGSGTTFEVGFPRAARTAPVRTVPEPAAPPQQRPHQLATLLLVEDEQAVLRLEERVLRERGYRVLAARDGFEALALAHAHAAEIDLLVTDVIMPDIRGHELAEQVAQIAPRARCLYTSGYPANDIGHDGMLDPGVEFLAKPFTAIALANRVREVLDRPGPAVH